MKYFFTILALLFFSILLSQQSQDYYWPLGNDREPEEGIQAFEFDFNIKPFQPQLRTRDLKMDMMNASICDADGNLLFYTNGCAVANRNHKIMPEGDSINAGPFLTEFWREDCSLGYPGIQDIMILPDPGHDSGYYIIHKPKTLKPGETNTSDTLQYTYVDMTLDNGLGDVTEKNVNIEEQWLVRAYLSSIAHSNGKDYWLLNPVFPTGYMVWLLDEEGIRYVKTEAGPVWDRWTGSSGDARFSPDGTKYAKFNQSGEFLQMSSSVN